MTVVVTGGSGKAGRTVIRELLEADLTDAGQVLGYEPTFSWRAIL